MKETLQCPGILGKASYRKSLEQVYILMLNMNLNYFNWCKI